MDAPSDWPPDPAANGPVARLRAWWADLPHDGIAGRRAIGLAAALLLEALLILMLLTLGETRFAPAGSDSAITTFDVGSPPPAEQAQEEPADDAEAEPVDSDTPPPPTPEMPPPAAIIPRPNPVPQPSPSPTTATIVPLTRDQMASADISRPDRPRAAAPAYGPSADTRPNLAMGGDSEVVGTAPDGEPLYAARWYREPTHQELAGYLSTASGPGWALIACKTAPQWRVEDCVGLNEYPQGSQLLRSVLAAAWQFQVRPPRRGGESLVGSWVRIRIEYRRQ